LVRVRGQIQGCGGGHLARGPSIYGAREEIGNFRGEKPRNRTRQVP